MGELTFGGGIKNWLGESLLRSGKGEFFQVGRGGMSKFSVRGVDSPHLPSVGKTLHVAICV